MASLLFPFCSADQFFSFVLPGANVNAAKLHETALHHAAKVKNADLVEMLVEFGGNVYARDNQERKPSDYTRSNSPVAKCFEFYESKSDSPNAASLWLKVAALLCISCSPTCHSVLCIAAFQHMRLASVYVCWHAVNARGALWNKTRHICCKDSGIVRTSGTLGP